MRDQMNHNVLAVTGTPTLQTGALTVDPNQALAFNGPTSSASAADSASLSMTGSMSIEFFLRLTAYPGTNQSVVVKSGSYAVQVNNFGIVSFAVVGPSSSVSVSSNVAIALNTWHHIVCVYNGQYAGVQQFGKSTLGATTTQVDDDAGSNKAACKFTLLEPALLTGVKMSLQYVDEIWPVQMRAVVYADDAGDPGALVATSDIQVLDLPNPAWRSPTLVTFPLSAAIPAGDYHLGYIADTVAGPLNKAVLAIGCNTTGGTTSRRPDSVTSPSDPFGAVSNASTELLAIYATYTATSRTGNEGKALIYINGSRNVSSAYTGGVADNANALNVCPTVAAQVDELSIWNRALSSVQIATHYTAH